MRQFILLATFIASVVLAVPTIKQDWAPINALDGSVEGSTYVYPHAAAFSDGRSIVVYTIQTPDSASRVMGQILHANGSVAVAEFDLEPDVSSINVFSAPKVVVFRDDTFLVAYRWDSGDPPSIQANRFTSDGTPIGMSSFKIDQGGVAVTVQGIELVAFYDDSYMLLYPSNSDWCTLAVVNDPNDNFVGSVCVFYPSTQVLLSPFAISNSERSAAYVGSESDDTNIVIGRINELVANKIFPNGPVDDSVPASSIAIALSGDRAISLLYNVGQNLTYSTISTDTLGGFRQGLLARGDMLSEFSSPAILGLNASSVLMAYKYKNTTTATEYLMYQTGHLVDLESSFDLQPTNDVLAVSTKLHAFHFTPLTGSDILVVAKDTETYAIKRQIITFCGNGLLELNEECDGSANCGPNCQCMNGLVGYNGVCGLPNVIPVLDCVNKVQGSNTLYFSFINEDRVTHTIDQGEWNEFSPAEYGGARPTAFSVGSTLTYPASPFTVTLPASETLVAWRLGSYNLTVDLTDVTSILCPESPGFIVDLAMVEGSYLNDDGALLASNFADRYGLSEYRLSRSVVQTSGSVPAKRRIYENRYDVTVTVAPANASSPSQELSSAEAVKAVVEDYKNSTTQADVTSDLLNNYGDAVIKDITPTPTGVETRGVRDSNTVPTPAQPTSSSPSSSSNNSPSTTTPSSTTVPRAVSGSTTVVPGVMGLLFIITLMQ